MRWWLFALLIAGCGNKASPPPAPKLMATAPGFASPVNIVDGPNQGANILGADSVHPIFTTSTGTTDGGASSTVTIQNDGGNPVPVDTTAGDLLSTTVHFVAAVGQGSLPDAGTFVAANFCNPGPSGAWLQFFFGQLAPDAGGTNDAGTVPSLVTPYVPPLGCGNLTEAQLITGGAAVWYSSSTQSPLTVDAGIQNLSVDVVRR